MAFSVQARVKIKIAGTMALNPSGTHAIQSLKEMIFLHRYKITVIINAAKEPRTKPTEASQSANELMIFR